MINLVEPHSNVIPLTGDAPSALLTVSTKTLMRLMDCGKPAAILNGLEPKREQRSLSADAFSGMCKPFGVISTLPPSEHRPELPLVGNSGRRTLTL